jgi:hypothetical protein
MQPIKIPMRGLAEVTSAKPTQKLSKLRKYRTPKSEDSVGRSNYYVKALSAIKKHHKGQTEIVTEILNNLLAEAAAETDPRKRAKLQHNYRAITDYLKAFGSRPLKVMPGKRLYYVYQDLVVGAHPDLVAEEDGHLVLIKLNLGQGDLGGGECSVILQTLYEAAHVIGLPVQSSGVECLQTSSGSRIVGPRRGFPDKGTLNRACQELLNLWHEAA